MPTEDVIIASDGPVLSIKLNRPEKKNALTGAMYDALTGALAEASARADIGVVVIEGSGGSFSAGNDLADFVAVAQGKADSRAVPFVRAIASFDKPIIAAVDGVAVGVGTTMLFHCDLVFATPQAKFRMPFVDIGLVPEAGSSYTVPARVGMAKATELLLLGAGFDAEEGVRLGIVNRVVPADQLSSTAAEAAKALAAKPRGALLAARRLIRGDGAAIERAIGAESEAFAAALTSPEARQAFEKFLSK